MKVPKVFSCIDSGRSIYYTVFTSNVKNTKYVLSYNMDFLVTIPSLTAIQMPVGLLNLHFYGSYGRTCRTDACALTDYVSSPFFILLLSAKVSQPQLLFRLLQILLSPATRVWQTTREMWGENSDINKVLNLEILCISQRNEYIQIWKALNCLNVGTALKRERMGGVNLPHNHKIEKLAEDTLLKSEESLTCHVADELLSPVCVACFHQAHLPRCRGSVSSRHKLRGPVTWQCQRCYPRCFGKREKNQGLIYCMLGTILCRQLCVVHNRVVVQSLHICANVFCIIPHNCYYHTVPIISLHTPVQMPGVCDANIVLYRIIV